jgi:uncharacterized caspase-like protein
MFRRSRKYAMVIGNASYDGRFALSNPRNDAAALADALRTLKFVVTLKTDLTHVAMNDAIDEFVTTLELTPVDVGLFYFSSHGLQLNEQNFLVPTDYKP